MDKSNYESTGAEFKDVAAELGVSFTLNVGLPTTAYHHFYFKDAPCPYY